MAAVDGEKLSIAEMAPETRWLIERMENAAVGELITYSDLNAAASTDVRLHRGYIQTAKRVLEKRGMVFSCVTKQGYKRLADLGKMHEAERRIKSVNSSTKKAARILATVETAGLKPEEQRQYLAQQAQVGTLQLISNGKTMRRLEKAIEQKRLTAAPSFEDAVKLLKES